MFKRLLFWFNTGFGALLGESLIKQLLALFQMALEINQLRELQGSTLLFYSNTTLLGLFVYAFSILLNKGISRIFYFRLPYDKM